MQRFAKILLFLIAFTITLVIGLAVAGVLLEEKIVSLSLEKINEQINVTLKAKDIKVSLVRSFPKASVRLKRVEIIEGSLDTPPEHEPGLLSLEEATLKFRLVGIIRNEYKVEELILKNGWINLYRDNTGRGNFEIIDTIATQSEAWFLDLDLLKLDNINLSYIDLRTGWIFKGLIKEARLKGQFSADLMQLNIRAKATVGSLRQSNFYYVRNQYFTIDTDFIVSKKLIDIAPSNAIIGSTKVSLWGSIGREVGSPISLNIKGQDLGLQTLVSFLSQHNLSIPPDTKTKGMIGFDFRLNGKSQTEHPFEIDLDFSSDRFEINVPRYPLLILSNINGNFTNGSLGRLESSEITIKNMSLETGASKIEGSLKLKNVLSPIYHLNAEHSIFVGDILAWGFELPLYEGLFYGNIESIGILDNIEKISLSSFENSKFYSDINLLNVSFIEVGRIPDLKNISGRLMLKNQDITSADVAGKIHGSNFDAELQISNATGIFFKNSKANINTSITIDSVNTSWLLSSSHRATNTDNGKSAWNRINYISGDVFIDELVHKNFIARPLSANFYMKEEQLFSNSFLGRSCNGMFTGRFSATTNAPNLYTLTADVDLDGVNISQLFQSFENFGQEIITHDKVSGSIDGRVSFSTPIDNGEIMRNQLEADSKLKISAGRLTNVKHLESLSRFVALEELEDITFSTLENRVSIANQTVTIPQMDINSSAIDLSLSGTHSFNGTYVYRLQLLLSDVLFAKASRKKPENTEFGEIEDDGSGRTKLFLRLEGDKDTYNVSYDASAARSAFRENLRQERETLKDILRDEFKFLRKAEDSLTKEEKNTDAEQKKSKPFTIEWEDE